MKLMRWRATRVVEYVEANLEGRITVEDVARSVDLSGSHFCRAFRGTFGMSVHRYVMCRRVARAQVLMLSTNDPLCDIALRCGLADQSHLTRWFRRVTGTTPALWRREHADRLREAEGAAWEPDIESGTAYFAQPRRVSIVIRDPACNLSRPQRNPPSFEIAGGCYLIER
jgi:AraC-like DNA-binding protein